MKLRLLPALLLLLPLAPSVASAADPTPADVLRAMRRVADWQLANPSKHRITDWTHGPYFLGLFGLHQVSGDERYLAALTEFGERAGWGPGPRVTHADDHAVLQAWLEAFRLTDDAERLEPTRALFPRLRDALAGRAPASVSGGTFTWCWCDALFMSPAVWVHLADITGDSACLDWADREWWTCTDVLYDPEACLYYRDNKYFERRTETGRKVFWSRGNGWVVGGLVHVLDRLPADHPSRERYLALYHDMMRALVELQGADGLWRSSLLEPEGPVGESSGSSFFTYALAWGLNRGLLKDDRYRTAVSRGWQALCAAIQPDGRLGFVQQIGERPGAAGPQSTEVYGTGAFLLAGAEIVRSLDPSRRRTDLATFEGLTLPARYLREVPRVHVCYVPDRLGDFAWENDRIAFRTYGPALRSGVEDSGFDVWLKRVPYPVIDKWYLEDRRVLPYGRVAKSYHHDHGEGCDVYQVGSSRGCGGISLWLDGALHDSDTFVAHRIVERAADRVVFELDYASKAGDRVVRETKRITVVLGWQLFQCESRFSVDGESRAFDVAIGLRPQAEGTEPTFSPQTGTMSLWEEVGGYGLGTGIAVEPGRVREMSLHPETGQALCLARTDDTGTIRWFAGYGWAGQGAITSDEAWRRYLASFAAEFVSRPFQDHRATLAVHRFDPPGEPLELAPVPGVPGAVRLKPNGGWCWYQGPRAVVLRDGRVVFTTVSGDRYAGLDKGDLWATAWQPETNELTHFELHDKLEGDDHDVAGLLELDDGRLLAVYGKHGSDQLQRWRSTTRPGDIGAWSEEQTFDTGARYTYSNVFRLASENGRLYNFSRSRGYNPNCTISEDDGRTWRYGWRLLSWTRADLDGDPRFTGIDGGRPYLRYASDGDDTIHFVSSDDHPRAYDNSIYHGFYRNGKLYDSAGVEVGTPGVDGTSTLKPSSFTELFRGGEDKVAWTVDLELDEAGRPYTAFSVQVDGAAGRGRRGATGAGQDHRYHYARFDGERWQVHEMAYAGTRLYPGEDDYTGLVALDPDDPDTVVVSTDAHPATGAPLISGADGLRHHELFRGTTADGGATWTWVAITQDSTADNLRPVIPSNPGKRRVVLWCRGDLRSYGNYRLDVCGIVEGR